MRADRSVAIVRADHIGDLVLTTPLIRALAKGGWHVDVIAPEGALQLLRHNSRIRNLTPLRNIAPAWPRGWWKLAGHLRGTGCDAVILPFAHPRQLLLASALSGAKKRIAMWAGVPGRLTGHTCIRSGYFDEARPYALTILRALEPLGIPADGIEPELTILPAEYATAEQALDAHLASGIRIGIHPVSLGNSCNLPPATYEALARAIMERTDWKIVITGSANDEAQLPGVARLAAAAPERIWRAFGAFDLRRLAAVIGRLDAYVVPSTGPLHIARALGTPTLTAFCPQLPVCAGIWGHPPLGISAMEPAHPPCDPKALHASHCDFRGTITAEDLFERLSRIVTGRKRDISAE